MADVCVVVGVGPGIGASVARRFAREGMAVALVARSEGNLRSTAQDIRRAGGEALEVTADAASPESLAAAFERIEAWRGAPAVLVYNAAVLRQGLAVNAQPEDVVHDFRINVLGALVCTQLVAEEMKRRRKGTILFTGGGLALEPLAGLTSLAVGKAGIRSLAHGLHKEMRADGIHVATVTVCGMVAAGTAYDPDVIAGEYVRLHQQQGGQWSWEHLVR